MVLLTMLCTLQAFALMSELKAPSDAKGEPYQLFTFATLNLL